MKSITIGKYNYQEHGNSTNADSHLYIFDENNGSTNHCHDPYIIVLFNRVIQLEELCSKQQETIEMFHKAVKEAKALKLSKIS